MEGPHGTSMYDLRLRRDHGSKLLNLLRPYRQNRPPHERFGPLTGASVNPARSTGPAIVAQNYEGLLIYWGGPIIGAVVAALLYEKVFMRHPVEPVEHGELAAR